MKKLLLSLACVLGLSTFASAETYTFTPTADNFVAETSIIDQGISFTVNKNKGSNNPTYVTDKDDPTKGDARIYAKGSIEITTNVNIKSISFAISTQGETRFATITPSVGAIAEQGKNPLVWNGEATSVTFTVGDKAAYGTDGDSKAGQLDFTSITIVTDGAASYGSTEGGGTTDPGTEEPEPEVTVYNTIAELIAAAPAKTTKVTVNGPLTVFYQSGKNTYVQDAAGTGLLVYDSTTELLKDNVNGDVIASVTGNYSPYNGLPEFVPTEVGTVTTGGAAVQPEEITVEELSIQDLNKYIKISGASISSLSGKNFTLKDETGEVAGYNTMSIELSEGENFTIVGVTNCYNTTLQVTPFSVDASQAVEACSAPTFSPNGGTVAYESEVTISTITEGASIFYSLDGSNPSIEYTAPIKLTSSCTVKAYASKEGLTNSEVSEATFTVLSADTKESTYDFTNPEGLTPAQERAEAGKFTSVAGVTFTSGSVSFAISEAATSNPPRLWTTSGSSEGAVDLRLYTGDSFTVSVPSGNKIKSIAFTKDGGNFAMEADNGTYDNGAWTGDSESIKFTMTATTRISTVTVLFEGDGSGVGSIVVDNENAPVEYYNLQGVRVANPTPGLYIVRQGTKVSKTVVR